MKNPVTNLDPESQLSGAKLLSMKIELGDGRMDTLEIHENEDPSILASQFIEKNSLPSFLSSSLTSLIQTHKDKAESRIMKPKHSFNSSFKSSQLTLQKSLTVSKSPVFKNHIQQLTKTNIGEQLYTKGVEMLKHKQEVINESYNDFSCSFKPSINEYSRLISPRFFENPEDILMRKSVEFKHKIEAQRDAALQEEMKECTFAPQINYTKNTLHRKSDVPIHHELFAEASRLKDKREKVVKEKYAHIHRQSKGKSQNIKKTFQEQEELADYLIKSKDEVWKKREEAMQKAQMTYDTPVKKSTRSDIHEYLYSKRNDKLNWTEGKQESLFSMMKSVSSPKIGDNSSKIYQELRLKKWKSLFESMDTASTGTLNTDNVSIEPVSKGVLPFLVPIFKDIEDGKEIELEEFSSIMENIWKNLNSEERGYLLKKEEAKKEEYEHRPFVSPKSQALAQKKYSRMSGDMVERFQHQNNLKEIKVLKAKEMNDEIMLKECTFRPRIKRKNK